MSFPSYQDKARASDKNRDDIVQKMPRRSLPVFQQVLNILRESAEGVVNKMKLYIYALDFFNSKTIVEHTCEVVAKSKVIVREDGKSFPAIYNSRINKTPMPRLHDAHNVVSLEPLTEEQVKKYFIDSKESYIRSYEDSIDRLKKTIETIKGAEFTKREPLEKGEA